MALFQELNDQGITVLVVTHEPDIARYARRIVEVRDGASSATPRSPTAAAQPRTCEHSMQRTESAS